MWKHELVFKEPTKAPGFCLVNVEFDLGIRTLCATFRSSTMSSFSFTSLGNFSKNHQTFQ